MDEPGDALTLRWIERNCFELFYVCIQSFGADGAEPRCTQPLVVSVSITGTRLPESDVLLSQSLATNKFREYLLQTAQPPACRTFTTLCAASAMIAQRARRRELIRPFGRPLGRFSVQFEEGFEDSDEYADAHTQFRRHALA